MKNIIKIAASKYKEEYVKSVNDIIGGNYKKEMPICDIDNKTILAEDYSDYDFMMDMDYLTGMLNVTRLTCVDASHCLNILLSYNIKETYGVLVFINDIVYNPCHFLETIKFIRAINAVDDNDTIDIVFFTYNGKEYSEIKINHAYSHDFNEMISYLYKNLNYLTITANTKKDYRGVYEETLRSLDKFIQSDRKSDNILEISSLVETTESGKIEDKEVIQAVSMATEFITLPYYGILGFREKDSLMARNLSIAFLSGNIQNTNGYTPSNSYEDYYYLMVGDERIEIDSYDYNHKSIEELLEEYGYADVLYKYSNYHYEFDGETISKELYETLYSWGNHDYSDENISNLVSVLKDEMSCYSEEDCYDRVEEILTGNGINYYLDKTFDSYDDKLYDEVTTYIVEDGENSNGPAWDHWRDYDYTNDGLLYHTDPCFGSATSSIFNIDIFNNMNCNSMFFTKTMIRDLFYTESQVHQETSRRILERIKHII